MIDQPDTTSCARAALPRRRWLPVIKTAIGVALIVGLLLWESNGRKLLAIFAGFQLQYLLALAAISLGLNAVSSIKWRLFLRDRGVGSSHIELFNLYLIGKFFSNFLPSMVGGDLARIYLLGRQISSHAISAASVGLERATGIIGLTMLAVIFAATNMELLINPIIALSLGSAVLACAAAITMFYWPGFAALIVGLLQALPGCGGLARKIGRLLDEVGYFRDRHRLVALSLLYSFAFHFLAAVNVYAACLSIGFAPAFADVLVITPVVLLLTMLPVSPNNLGWWEWCFSVLLLDAGATAAEGFAVAVTLRAVTMVVSLIGGLLFLMQRSGAAGR
jgi:glycosyltransferase 2 family protein